MWEREVFGTWNVSKKAFFFFSCGGDKENEILFVKSENSKEFFSLSSSYTRVIG